MRFYLFIFLLLITSCAAEKEIGLLYKNRAFELHKDKLIEGEFESIAKSNAEISSNYNSPEAISTRMEIKFGINGNDNELPVGVNHIIIINQSTQKLVADTITFGKRFVQLGGESSAGIFKKNSKVSFFLDFRYVLDSLDKNGFFILNSGDSLLKENFKSINITGNTTPLSWNFNKENLQLSDKNNDGIYQIEITFNPVTSNNKLVKTWKLSKDISRFPQYKSDQTLLDALYKLSLEETILNLSKGDSVFMTGKEWPGVWTRDISYSTLLSLAIIMPDIAMNSLRRKVENGVIIQDTGTGGSWPISSDRTTWALAAWEIFKVTGDLSWLNFSFSVIQKSINADLKTLVNKKTALFHGEQSFLDWREQSYPLWMQAADIYSSQSLGTNAVHFRTYEILSKMAYELGRENSEKYFKIAQSIKEAMNSYLWMSQKGYYAEYLYGRNYFIRSPKAETLGESLAVLFEIANKKQQKSIIEKIPVLEYGTPCFFPQIPKIPPYHNNAIWPFVNAYYTWAAAKVKNTEAVKYGLATTWRQAALFLTNKENMVAESGSFKGTQINSDRQLWSVAGNLALFYRVLLGMNFKIEGLELNPFIPKEYTGNRTLSNFKYRESNLEITIKGYGFRIKKLFIDEIEQENLLIPASIKGKHNITIELNNEENQETKINLVENKFALETPKIRRSNTGIIWNKIEDAEKYAIFRNGKFLSMTLDTSFSVRNSEIYKEFQVSSIAHNLESFLSEPFLFASSYSYYIHEAENFAQAEKIEKKGKAVHYIEISKRKNRTLQFKFFSENQGSYIVDFRYANGSASTTTDNKCAIRSLYVNRKYIGAVIFPQRGLNEWDNWGSSNSLSIYLKKGINTIELKYKDFNNNMNGEVNKALIDKMIIIKN